MTKATLDRTIKVLKDQRTEVERRAAHLKEDICEKQVAYREYRAQILGFDKALELLEADQPETIKNPRQPPGAVASAIMAQFDGGRFGAMNVADLATRTRQKPASVRAAVKKLVVDGKLVMTADGYDVPSAKKQARPASDHAPPAAAAEAARG